jgi:hypothetical protein
LHGLASNPASAGSSAEPLPLAVSAAAAAAAAAAGDDGASLSADKEEAAARQLTHNIANADSVYQLAEIFTAHSSVMDMIHITACITRLSKVLGTAPSAASQAAASSLLPLLGNKLLQVLPNANARGIANVLWGYGRLRNLRQSDLLPELLKAFLQQLPTAACRDSAVVLWSLARLTEGQGMAAVGVTPDLLSRLGRQVLEQLSTSAAAALDGQSTHQPPPPQHGKHDRNEGDPSAPPSSRDVSNSLMALTRLGFAPESAAAATAAAAAAAPADKSTPAAGPAEKGAPAAAAEGVQPAQASPSAAPAATAAADDDQAAPAAALESLSLDAAAPAAAASKADQEKPADKQEPAVAAAAAATAAGSSDSQAKEQQQQQLKPLTLTVAPIKVLVQFLLRHAAVTKTLDLQESATALKQLGLQDLSAQVAAAICSPAPGGPGQHGMFDAPGHHHGMGMGPGSMQYGHSGGMQHFHQHMGPGSGMQHGFGGGMRPGGGHMYGGPGLSGRPGSGSYGGAAAAAGVGGGSGAYGSSASNAVLARNQPGPPHTPSVSMPSTINLSGTQLAGLLQQQRRQQPLPMSGPAYGAGWLPGKTSQAQQHQQQVHRQGSSGAACVVPGVDGSGMMGQQQQQQYRMYMPGGSSGAAGGSPGMRRLSGGAHAGMSYAADASQAGGYMSGPGPAGGAGMHDYMQPNTSMQYQQQYQRRQQQQPQQPHGHQEQWGAQMASGQGMRRLSGAQHTEVPQQQLQQHQQQGYGMPAGQQQQPGVQYMFVPQQYNTQQQQQQAGTYSVPQQGIQQQQQQPGMGVMMQQVLQQPQQQQTVAGQQQMVMVPVSMASGMFNIAQPVSSLPGQQQQGLAVTPGVMQMQMQPQQVAGTDTWIGQGYAGAAQQQQSQQLMEMLPQIQAAATAAGTIPAGQAFGVQGGPAGVAAAGMPYQVSGGMLVGSAEYVMPVESKVVVGGQMSQMVGSGQLSADYAAIGLAAPVQQQQVYGGMPGAGGSMLQQQGARVGLDPPGLYVPQQQQQQQQQQDAMQLMYGMVQQGMPTQQQQQQQQGVVMMGPGAGYAFPGGQYQQQ